LRGGGRFTLRRRLLLGVFVARLQERLPQQVARRVRLRFVRAFVAAVGREPVGAALAFSPFAANVSRTRTVALPFV
jgi:hypothetical protein